MKQKEKLELGKSWIFASVRKFSVISLSVCALKLVSVPIQNVRQPTHPHSSVEYF